MIKLWEVLDDFLENEIALKYTYWNKIQSFQIKSPILGGFSSLTSYLTGCCVNPQTFLMDLKKMDIVFKNMSTLAPTHCHALIFRTISVSKKIHI